MSKAKLWRWTDTDVERVRKYKQENYRKGRGRKPQVEAVEGVLTLERVKWRR